MVLFFILFFFSRSYFARLVGSVVASALAYHLLSQTILSIVNEVRRLNTILNTIEPLKPLDLAAPSKVNYQPERTEEDQRIVDYLQHEIASVCPHTIKANSTQIRYRHLHWQLLNEDEVDEIVVYSAFYDDRPIVGYLPWIRILGVRRLIVGQKEEVPLFCYVWYSEFSAPFVADVNETVTGRNHDIKEKRVYGQRLFSCPLTVAHPVPTHVSIATRKCDPSSILLPVFRPLRAATWKHEFGVCVESSFGSFPPEVISEWIETYSLFGVTQFNLYNGSLKTSMDRIFDYYVQRGIVNLRQLPPSVDDYSEEGIRLSSPTSLNDCMMRNMYSNRFIVVVDFDEIIVPRNHSSYQDLIADLDASLSRTQSHHTYSFRNSYFFLFFPADDSQPPLLRTARLRHRTPPSGFLFSPKSFVDPRKCLSVFNHYCLVNVPGMDDEDPIDVPVSLGLNHHYRHKCPLTPEECGAFDQNKLLDDTMLRFKDVLQSRVSTVMEAIYGNS